MNYPIIYLHIPKTAGTSFRISAAQFFGNENVLFDYGADSLSTSEELVSTIESQQDAERVRDAGLRAKMLGGHFSLPKYQDLFPESPVVSFFRDPVDRVVSEYVHFCNHHQYEGTLENFYRTSRFQNRQHRSLGGAKAVDLDFYGLTERYEESLNLFNRKFSTSLKVVELNKGNYGEHHSKVRPSDKQRAEILHLNQADVSLYKMAVDHFDKQNIANTTTNKPAIRYKGSLGSIRQDNLHGWIFNRESSTPTEVHVSVNGEKRLALVADVERPDIVRSGLRTEPRCGFIVPLSRLGELNDDDSISIQTADGKYELHNSPLVLNA